MRKYILLFLLASALGLASCMPQATPIPTSTVAKSTSTATARPATTVVQAIPTEPTNLPSIGCTVITQKPTPGPTAETIYPPVGASDWVKGPDNAKVTIIEYSDFQ